MWRLLITVEEGEKLTGEAKSWIRLTSTIEMFACDWKRSCKSFFWWSVTLWFFIVIIVLTQFFHLWCFMMSKRLHILNIVISGTLHSGLANLLFKPYACKRSWGAAPRPNMRWIMFILNCELCRGTLIDSKDNKYGAGNGHIKSTLSWSLSNLLNTKCENIDADNVV